MCFKDVFGQENNTLQHGKSWYDLKQASGPHIVCLYYDCTPSHLVVDHVPNQNAIDGSSIMHINCAFPDKLTINNKYKTIVHHSVL